MGRRLWLRVGFTLLLAARAEATPPDRLNFVFIAVDDLRPALGCYGDPIARTPAIDRLAESGVRFDRAYAQFPGCNPSRSSLLTGRYPAATGVFDNQASFRARLPDAITLPEYFRSRGYVTLREGKIFHPGLDEPQAWGRGGRDGSTPPPRADAPHPTPSTPGRAPPRQPPTPVTRSAERDHPWRSVPGEGEGLPDAITTNRAIALLELHRHEPFFLAVGFSRPHTPFVAPGRYFAQFTTRRMPLPIDFAFQPTVPPGAPAAALPPRNHDLFETVNPTADSAREARVAYYASVSFVDGQILRLLDALDRLGLRDRTAIVFFGDHGFHLGEKGKWSKHESLYEVATRVPLIVAVPGAYARGAASVRTVELVDLYPTLAALAGLPVPAGLDGQNLAPLVRDPQAAWAFPAYSVTAFLRGRSVRTDRWRYAEWSGEGGGAELYDHETDPHELENRVGDPAHAATVEALKRLLRESPATGG
jgi:arylsulfatase A-like enzyme